jgi:hypothetical protein
MLPPQSGFYFLAEKAQTELTAHPDRQTMGFVELLRRLHRRDLGDIPHETIVVVDGLGTALTALPPADLSRILYECLSGRANLIHGKWLRIVFLVDEVRSQYHHFIISGSARLELEAIFGERNISEPKPGLLRAQPI